MKVSAAGAYEGIVVNLCQCKYTSKARSTISLDDRGHVVERSVNRRTNEREEKHDYLNMDEGKFATSCLDEQCVGF